MILHKKKEQRNLKLMIMNNFKLFFRALLFFLFSIFFYQCSDKSKTEKLKEIENEVTLRKHFPNLMISCKESGRSHYFGGSGNFEYMMRDFNIDVKADNYFKSYTFPGPEPPKRVRSGSLSIVREGTIDFRLICTDLLAKLQNAEVKYICDNTNIAVLKKTGRWLIKFRHEFEKIEWYSIPYKSDSLNFLQIKDSIPTLLINKMPIKAGLYERSFIYLKFQYSFERFFEFPSQFFFNNVPIKSITGDNKYLNIFLNWFNCRLPTKAEWEYICQQGYFKKNDEFLRLIKLE